MKTSKTRKKCFHVLLTTFLLLASSFSIAGVKSSYAQSAESSVLVPDTLIRGVVKGVHLNYEIVLNKVNYGRLTALITVQITEILERPENFSYLETPIRIGDFVDVSYNYSDPPACGVDDIVEVYGFWVSTLYVPFSQTTRVDDRVLKRASDDAFVASYVKVIAEGIEIGETGPSKVETNSEYSNGSISHGPGVNLWYTWVNASGTQVAFFTYYSEVYNSPIQTFLGQHYMADNETEVFIGNTLLLMEAYNDTDRNGVPEADFGEIKYFFLVNSSETFTTTPVQKVITEAASLTSDSPQMSENITHYIWGIQYGWVDGFLLFPRDRVIDGVSTSIAARVNISSLTFTYNYYVQGNVSYLKTGFKAGRVVDFEPHASDVSLNGLGLSLLYGTTMLTTKPYAILVNGESYNSKLPEAPTTSTSRAEVVVGNKKLYEFIFEENYTLYRNSVPESYVSKSVASPIESIPSNAAVYLSPYWLVGSLLRLLSEDVFPELSASLPNIGLEYANSSFVYRVCYPKWEGWSIEHDPTYVAYLVSQEIPPISPPAGLPIETIATVAVAVAGLSALALALTELRRTRRILKANPLTMHNIGGKRL